MRVVRADGEAVELREGDDLLAGRVSLGALGAISAVTLRCVPAFRIHRVDEPAPLDDVLASFDRRVAANDHFELFVFPYTRTALTLTSERTDRKPRKAGPVKAFLRDLMLENGALELACRLGRRFPSRIPSLNRTLVGAMSRAEHLDASYRVYANRRTVRFTEMEYALPQEHTVEALERVLALVERRRLPIGFPIEVRVAAPDDALLSTAHGRDDRLRRRPPVPRHGVRELLPGGRGDHGRVRRPSALGQAPLPDRCLPALALSRLRRLPGRARPARPRPQVRQRLPEEGPGVTEATATLYAIPGSHAAQTGELMVRHKGIHYRRVNLMPGFHRVFVRLRGFPGDRVPAVRFADGRKAQGTRPLARALDDIVPEPRLVPADPRVEEAERWGEQELQPWARRMVVEAGTRDPDSLEDRGAQGRLGPLLTSRTPARRTMARVVKIAFRMTPSQLADDQTRVGEVLDRVDGLIAEGVLAGEQLNCADFQIATSLALIDYRLDVRAQLRGRPAGALVERVLPFS